MALNNAGINLPEECGSHIIKPYAGPYAALNPATGKVGFGGGTKMRASLRAAIEESGLKDGMTITFHHHFREGDKIIGQVLTVIEELGIRGLRFAPSAVVNLRNPSIVRFIESGVINRVEASGIRGELGDAVIAGAMEQPVILRPHGGRPRAIAAGELTVDVAFIGVSAADEYGNANGLIGENACGALGYSHVDAQYGKKVIAVTDTIVPYPCTPAIIRQETVDMVVHLDEIGDSELIGKGAARLTRNPRDLLIAKNTAAVIAHCGCFENGFSFQTGAGAIPIACTKYVGDYMQEKGIKAGFALGGVTSGIVDLLNADLIGYIEAVQSFDAVAARAMLNNSRIVECDSNRYANPHNKGCMVNRLDIAVLGALEVDVNFNVNILTGSSGEMLGGLGGGPDVAAGAKVPIVALPLFRGRTPSIVEHVFTLCTPGETVAAIVTEIGVALNPRHRSYDMLRSSLKNSGVAICSIEDMKQLAEKITGIPEPIHCTDRIVALVEYRDGTIIDVIRQLDK
ncbi:MAG: citrate lyase subunit alpha [Candidatus Fimivivens sp.]|nr:citrate lyase subunit alpha [Candidatus Fimivivens sp.]